MNTSNTFYICIYLYVAHISNIFLISLLSKKWDSFLISKFIGYKAIMFTFLILLLDACALNCFHFISDDDPSKCKFDACKYQETVETPQYFSFH